MKHVVALSGGKDSTALALWLAENEPREYTYAITPTGNEMPEMIAHWLKIAKILGKPLTPITSGSSLQGLIRKDLRLPNHRQRWCTRRLKLEPYYAWLGKQAPVTSYVGLRADEESRPGMIFPDTDGVTMRFPLREIGWKEQDVWDFLAERDISIPARTDCAMCFWQTLAEWFILWRDYLELYMEAENLERLVSAYHDAPFSFRSPDRDTWPAGLKELRMRFEAGEIPERSLKMMEKKKALRGVGACRVCTL